MIAAIWESKYTMGVVVGACFGILARLFMLRTDYRQYPTYPHGRIIHISLGVIAAGLGAVAIPSLFEKDYTAMTFLALAAQQFRDVRNMERETLTRLDKMELVPRGATYIEGIAMVFEGRNYLVIFTSFITALFSISFHWLWGIPVGILSLLLAKWLKSGKTLQHIVDIQSAPVRVEGANLYVDDIYIMNVGLRDSQDKIKQYGLGLVLTPKNQNCRVTIANLGQRQALLHDMSTILGVVRDSGEPSLIPMAKLDMNDGRLAVFLLPQLRDEQMAVTAASRVPILESAVRMPSEVISKDKEGTTRGRG